MSWDLCLVSVLVAPGGGSTHGACLVPGGHHCSPSPSSLRQLLALLPHWDPASPPLTPPTGTKVPVHGPGKGSTYCSNIEDKDRGRFDAGEGEDGEEEGCGWEKKMFFGPLLITSFPCQVAMLVLYHRLLPMAQGSVQDKLLHVKQSPSQHAAPAPLPQGSVRLEVEKGPERDEAFIKTGPRNAVQPPAQKCCLKGWGGYASLPAALMLCAGGPLVGFVGFIQPRNLADTLELCARIHSQLHLLALGAASARDQQGWSRRCGGFCLPVLGGCRTPPPPTCLAPSRAGKPAGSSARLC